MDYSDQILQIFLELRGIYIKAESVDEDKTRTFLQFGALDCVINKKDPTVKEVANHVNISMSSATQLIDRLVVEGLINRETDQEDRRNIHLIITPKGRKEYDETAIKIRDKINKLFNKIPKEEIAIYIKVQKHILEILHYHQTNDV